MRRAFVAGATGYTGRAVVEVLVEQGVHAIAHVRPDSPRLEEYRREFEAIGAEVDSTEWDLTAFQARLSQLSPDVVFALLGTTKARMSVSEAAGQRDSYESVDYGLTVLLLAASQACEPPPRFVYLSAAGVSPSARGAYYRARARAEAAIIASGVQYVIARPSFITGDRAQPRPGESVAATVADALLGVAAVFGGRRMAQRYRSMTARELAEGLVRSGLAAESTRAVVEAEDLRA